MLQCVLMTRFHGLQDLYSAAPVALAPFLGNPVLLATFGIDRSAPLLDQVISFTAARSHPSRYVSQSLLPVRQASPQTAPLDALPSWCSCSNLGRVCAACCHSCRLLQRSCRPQPLSGSSSSSKRAAGIHPQASCCCKQCRLAMQSLVRLTGTVVKAVSHKCTSY